MTQSILATAMALTCSVAFAQTAPQTVEAKATALGETAYGVQVHRVAGATVEDMVRTLSVAQTEQEEIIVNGTEADMEFGDQTRWGTTAVGPATNLYLQMDEKSNANGSTLDRTAELQTAEQLLRELSAMPGVGFGFTSGSSSYCGVSFMGLLVVDTTAGVVYEIALTNSDTCF